MYLTEQMCIGNEFKAANRRRLLPRNTRRIRDSGPVVGRYQRSKEVHGTAFWS